MEEPNFFTVSSPSVLMLVFLPDLPPVGGSTTETVLMNASFV